jgi:hypothetical protein
MFISFIFPIIQGIGEVLLTLAESVKSKINISIVKNSCEIEKLKIELEPINTQAIGFHSDEGYIECEDNEEDCSHGHKTNKHMGF